MDTLHDGRRLPTVEEEPCPTCHGLGYLIDKKKYSFISKNLKIFDTFVPCPDCHGTGYQQPEDDEIPY